MWQPYATDAVFPAGDTVDDWLEPPARLKLIGVHSGWKPHFLGKLVEFFESDQIPVLQALWCDAEGNYPDDSGWSLEGAQFMLHTEPEY